MNRIEVVHGVVLPLIPMQPSRGRRLHNRNSVEAFASSTLAGITYVVQPKLRGDRMVVASVDGVLHFQDGKGRPAEAPLNGSTLAKKLADRSVFDGVVHCGVFYPFDVLAYAGKSMVNRSAAERDALAYQFNRLLGNVSVFNRPTKTWLMARKENEPKFAGVVIKEASSRYVAGIDGSTKALTWITREW